MSDQAVETAVEVLPKLCYLVEMQPNQLFLSSTHTIVCWWTGKIEEQYGIKEYELMGKSIQGELVGPFFANPKQCAAHIDEVKIKEVLESYDKRSRGEITRKTTRTIVNPATGEVTKVASKPRGNTNPRTGYGEGTDGHMFGLILLDTPRGAAYKGECLAKIWAILQPRGKKQGYANSWFTYLRAKKPEIYHD